VGFKLGLLTGAVVGFYIGTRISEEQQQRLEAQVRRLREDPRVSKVTSSLSRGTTAMADAAAARTAGTADDVADRVAEAVSPDDGSSVPGQPSTTS